MRTLILIAIVASGVLGGWTLVRSQTEALTFTDCQRELSDGVRSGALLTDGGLAPFLRESRVVAGAGEICRGVLRWDHPLDDEPVLSWFARMQQQRPALLLPLCQVMVNADVARYAHLLRFATSRERNRYRTEHCRLARSYITRFRTPPEVTTARMIAENAEVYVPVCASYARHGMSKSWPSLTPAQLQLISRRTCATALTEGVATYGIPPITDRSFDGNRWGEIAVAVAGEVVAAPPQG